jgi:NAD(P)-dependent dehydrogenase (short-subunit alcohol dehydrogenase family)
MHRFAGKVAIVTGGANGIGEATAKAFAREGASVTIADLDRNAGAAVAATIQNDGGKAIFLETDVADERAVSQMSRATVEAFGRIDILVNCAAEFIMRGVGASVEEWRRVMDVNVMGCALCAREVVSEMKKVGKGAIVNIGSAAGFVAVPEFLTYGASKSAVANMTRCMALELAPCNIRVNAVCPGYVWTARNKRIVEEAHGFCRDQADSHPHMGGANMLKRAADTEEIAAAILFLASDEASFITAESLMADGGQTGI